MPRSLRIIRNVVLTLLAIVLVAVGLLTLTPPGRGMLASIASSLASGEGRTVTISGIRGIWTGPLSVETVTVEDADGPWLALQDISTDISYLDLISMKVSADTLRVGRVEVARQPLPAPASADSSTGSFQLPVDIDIRKIDLPQIALGPDLAGEAATLSATSKVAATASPLRIETQAQVARTDQRQGELDLSLVFAPDENRLDVKVEGHEPQGGVVANLLKLPGAPPVSIAIEGSGPASDWRGQGAVAVNEAVAAKFTGRHQFVEGGSRIELNADGEFAQFLPEIVRTLGEGQSSISFAGTLKTDGAIAIEQASIASSALTGNASGSLDPQGVSDLTFNLQARGEPVALSFSEGENLVSVAIRSAEGSIAGTGAKPSLDAAVSLASLVHPQATLRDIGVDLSSPGFDVATRTGPVMVRGRVGAAETLIAPLVPFLVGQIALAADTEIGADSIDVRAASIENDVLKASAAGTLSRVDGQARFDLNADVARSALPQGAHAVLGERVTLAGRITRDADRAIDASGLKVASGPLTTEGSIRIADGKVTADLDGALSDLSRLAADVAGAASFELSANGPLFGPDLSVTLSSERIESGGRAITGLELKASGKADLVNPAADVSLSGKVGDETLTGSAKLSSTDGRRTLSGLNISLGANRISGDLDLDEAFLPKGSIAFELPDIAPLAALALQQVSGSASGNVTFDTVAAGPSARVDARVPSFSRDTVSGKDISIEAQITNYVAAPAVSGRIRAGAVNAGAEITAVDVTLSRDGVWTAFDGGATVNGIPVKATGRAKYENGEATVELTRGGATVQGVAATIAKPSTIVNAGGVTRITNLALGLSGGTATINGTAGGALDLNVQLAGVPASIANGFAPGLGAAGTVSGTVRVTGAPAAPSIGYDLRLAGAETSQTRSAGFGAMTIASTGTFAGGTLRFQADVGEGGGLSMKGGGTVQTGGSRALNVNFAGRVPFGFLTRRLAAQGLALDGAADISLAVTGSTNSPVIGGTVRTSGARFVDAGSGIAINGINADIALGAGSATLRSFTGTISTGGSVSASGTVGLDAAAGFPADLSVKVTDGRYTDGRVVTANFGGDIAVKGPLTSAPTLGGTINLGRTVITIPEKLSPSLSRLNVQHRNASGEVKAQAEALKPATSSGGGGGLMLDLSVNAPNQLFVQGRGLNAELGGTIKLTGPASSPSATGLFTLRRGRLAILGRRLDFSEGSIGFSGSLVPTLDFTATSAVNSATTTVTVSGEATNPKFSFSSSSSMPEDEVLAQLVFGRAMGSLSAVQIAQLAQAAAVLAGVGGSTSLLDNLQSQLGVDDIDVKTDEETGDTSVSVGKYLNDRTYLSIEKGSQPGSGKAAIDLNVGRGVKLRGEATDSGETKGGIFFEREY
ncbi:translocation/assembly module TamB domain-containing protein [Mesorhizobium australicum]|uniref:Autotransporter secretion inner membrane protein TamB n=1 Tax=Mesorhizobium australicum TaxID=536018 RepID=A0A1X7PGX0_9HYPH|nr:translocation/assembly module TamB domain-containing protein [Mesorhizobium australicum]SMH50563.1 autotransporter secretion inner membrane protein TamB [Mesorhizobium australicum]